MGGMSEDLVRQKCIPCRGGELTLTETEIARLKPNIPSWSLTERQGIKRLERGFKFKNFAEALAFTDKIGALAESENHHPAILTEWGRVRVSWWTHKIRGLHKNDFIMAAKTDALAPAQR
jgi:4a-hydroxytetrahydrobiopterin dehydratase